MQLIEQIIDINEKTIEQYIDYITQETKSHIYCPHDICKLIALFIVRVNKCRLYSFDINTQSDWFSMRYDIDVVLNNINNNITWSNFSIRRGDIIKFPGFRNFTIFDGNKLVTVDNFICKLNGSCIKHVGMQLWPLLLQFDTINEFPLNYWSFIPEFYISISINLKKYLPEINLNRRILPLAIINSFHSYRMEISSFIYKNETMVIFTYGNIGENFNGSKSIEYCINNMDISGYIIRCYEPLIHRYVEKYTSIDEYYHICMAYF